MAKFKGEEIYPGKIIYIDNKPCVVREHKSPQCDAKNCVLVMSQGCQYFQCQDGYILCKIDGGV